VVSAEDGAVFGKAFLLQDLVNQRRIVGRLHAGIASELVYLVGCGLNNRHIAVLFRVADRRPEYQGA